LILIQFGLYRWHTPNIDSPTIVDTAADGRSVALSMLGTRPEYPASGTSDRSVTADALLRQEPEEEDKDDGKRKNEDDDDTTDDGYSEASISVSGD